jgi:hypothetical protein
MKPFWIDLLKFTLFIDETASKLHTTIYNLVKKMEYVIHLRMIFILRTLVLNPCLLTQKQRINIVDSQEERLEVRRILSQVKLILTEIED